MVSRSEEQDEADRWMASSLLTRRKIDQGVANYRSASEFDVASKLATHLVVLAGDLEQ
jgi:hypothetical protein